MKYNIAFTPKFNADPSGSEPVALSEIKEHLRISNTAEDDWLEAAGKAARMRLESYCGEFFKPRNITVIFKNELGGYILPYQPNGTVTYKDINTAVITNYDYKNSYNNVITATYDAGYGFSDNPVPEDVRAAILAQVAFMYANRGDSNVSGKISEIAKDLVSAYKTVVL